MRLNSSFGLAVFLRLSPQSSHACRQYELLRKTCCSPAFPVNKLDAVTAKPMQAKRPI